MHLPVKSYGRTVIAVEDEDIFKLELDSMDNKPLASCVAFRLS